MLIHKGYQGSHFDYLGHSSVNELCLQACREKHSAYRL